MGPQYVSSSEAGGAERNWRCLGIKSSPKGRDDPPGSGPMPDEGSGARNRGNRYRGEMPQDGPDRGRYEWDPHVRESRAETFVAELVNRPNIG